MKKLALICLLPLLAAGCTNVKHKLGLERSQPDEFSVAERAPLTMPPNFNLVPPQPGAPRPQETQTSATAQGLVLGTGTGATTVAPKDDTAQQMPAVPNTAVASSSLNGADDADLLSDAKSAANKPVAKPKKAASDNSVLRPTDESLRLQSQNINTTVSPVMKSAQ